MGCPQAIMSSVVGLATACFVMSSALAASSNVRPAAKQVPAMYVFGDSTVDVGNNNYLPGDFPRADKPYYGVDFPGGARPTGRWSNGYNIADFVGMAGRCRRRRVVRSFCASISHAMDGWMSGLN